MLRQIWAHCRDIRVDAFQNKIVYNIPLYFNLEKQLTNFTVQTTPGNITLTLYREPIQPHLEESSSHNQKTLKEPLGENDKCLSSHQQVFHKMK
jgi:hypothetical protein